MTTVLRSHSELETLPGGKYRLMQYIKPIAYEDGLWKRIVNDWTDGDQNFPHAVTTAPMLCYTAADGLRRICPTREADRYIEIGAPYVKVGGVWTKVTLGTPTRTGNLLTWTRTNYNAYIHMGGHFLKLGFLLKNNYRPEGGLIAFPVGMGGLTRSGGLFYRDGVAVLHVQVPVVYDWNNPLDVRPIAYDFVQLGGQWYVLLTLPDLAGMSLPLIDPTLTLQPGAADGTDNTIYSDAPTTNYGSLTAISVGETGTNSIRRGLTKFDLSSLLDSAIISATTFSLCVLNDNSSNARTLRVFRQKRAWVESESTWNIYSTGNNWSTAGGFHADDCEQTDIGSRNYTATEALNVFTDISLTPTTKSALDLGNGWLYKMDVEDEDEYDFYSSDHATAANRPKLVVEYTLPKAFARAPMWGRF